MHHWFYDTYDLFKNEHMIELLNVFEHVNSLIPGTHLVSYAPKFVHFNSSTSLKGSTTFSKIAFHSVGKSFKLGYICEYPL